MDSPDAPDQAPARPSAADTVHAELHRRILTLDLPPGTRLSEIDIARRMGVSRQPVRDAFYRLSQLGFLSIRPQRATLVSQISERALSAARFLRTALELETVRLAAARLQAADIVVLRDNLHRQAMAMDSGDRERFHALDDALHQQICVRSGVGFAWEVIRSQKAHMDRVRFLSLAFASQRAFDDHVALVDALAARDVATAETVLRAHLGRIEGVIGQIRRDHAGYFADEPPQGPGA